MLKGRPSMPITADVVRQFSTLQQMNNEYNPYDSVENSAERDDLEIASVMGDSLAGLDFKVLWRLAGHEQINKP